MFIFFLLLKNKTGTEENEHEPLLNDDSGAAENIPPSYGKYFALN